MATAIQELHPEAKFGVGPVVEDGFYYDVDLEQTLSSDDLQQIEKKMAEVVKADYPFEHITKKLDEAVKYFEDKKQPYKVELLKDLKQHGTTVAKEIDRDQLGVDPGKQIEEVGFYTDGPFTDLCRGPHVESTGKVGAFKLMRVSGAYWRGSEKNPQLQRVYGVGFATKEELKLYIERLEEAEKRDHRKLGRELDLFVSSPLIGSGLPLFTPRGTVLRDEIDRFSQELRQKRGYQRVWIPHIAKLDTYKTSGHFEKFPELLRFTSSESGDELALKPVNCPHHTQIYASRARSYRELPVKYLETTSVYRDEKSGELGGLSRVRAITQDDSHVFCTEDQVEQVFAELIEDARTLYGVFGLELSFTLSFRDDSDAYLGDKQAWARAEKSIHELADRFGLEYEIGIGEAAIYGPKIDFMVKDALGRKHQLATVQLDYAQPERFDLEYIDADGIAKRPVMIHCAILGSLERFLSVYIEHTAGAFPTWVAPEQVRVVTVNDDKKVVERAEELCQQLHGFGIRAELDLTNESVGKKIREAGLAKVPYTIVVGEKEAESNKVSPRLRQGHGEEPGEISVETFIDGLRREIAERRERSVF
jgi:threonyl-tRNA synthetase